MKGRKMLRNISLIEPLSLHFEKESQIFIYMGYTADLLNIGMSPGLALSLFVCLFLSHKSPKRTYSTSHFHPPHVPS